MITINDTYKISELISSIIFYGLVRGYSYSSIEERMMRSEVIRDLENGDSSFLYKTNIEEIVQKMYALPEEVLFLGESNSLSMWLGDIYTKLFFKKNKSFSYLFLYYPLNKAIDDYDIYHEMDINQLIKHFSEIEKENTIISLLLKKRGLKVRELSALADVNINTIVSYTRDNENVYNAKYQTIYEMSNILNINPNIFIKRINNFTNSEMYAFDKTNPIYRLYLAYYLASYFDKEIAETKYDQVDNNLVNSDSVFSAIWTSPTIGGLYTPNKNEEISKLVKEYKANHKDNKKTTLVIFEFNQISDNLDSFLDLINEGFYKIIIINQCYYFSLSKNKKIRKEILDFVNEASIRKAKAKMSEIAKKYPDCFLVKIEADSLLRIN